ncbi:MAG: cupin domain-containing protein [Cyanobacteria bacterium SIG28]|nr:cupin domain-containing protein [Cyanobacteria bacterium SIG28]
MYYNVLKIEDLVENKENLFDRNVLLERGESSLSAIALKKHEVLDNHISVCDACAYVFEGEAEFHFAAEKFTVKKGELIMFEKEKEHRVLALKDTKFLLIKI